MFVASHNRLLKIFQEGTVEMEEKVQRDLEDLRDQKVIKANQCCKKFLVTQPVAFIVAYESCFLLLKFTGDAGEAGNPGRQGLAGPHGRVGPEGPGLSGVSYNRWGRTNCSKDAIIVYTGKHRKRHVFGINCNT